MLIGKRKFGGMNSCIKQERFKLFWSFFVHIGRMLGTSLRDHRRKQKLTLEEVANACALSFGMGNRFAVLGADNGATPNVHQPF
jgi:hypothetical protein